MTVTDGVGTGWRSPATVAAPRPWPDRAFRELVGEVAGRVGVPPLPVTAAAGRRVIRRRRTGRLVATVFLVAAATAAAGTMLRPGNPVAAGTMGSAAVPVVSFADPRHGYAYVARCEPAEPCAARLYATSDGGATWAPMAEPVTGLRLGDGVTVRAIGARTVLLDNGDERWVSRDRGRRWRLRGPGPAAPLATVPDGARPFLGCPDEGREASCRGVRLVTESPRDGLVHALVGTPPEPLSAVTAASDGVLWSVGVDPATAGAAVGKSIDRGRTWSVIRVPLPKLAGVSARITAADGRRAFLVVSANGSGWFGRQFAALYGTVDGGRRWTLAPRRGMPYRSQVDALALTGGRLVLIDPRGTVYVSDDAGATFVRTAQLRGYLGAEVAPGLIVVRTDNGTAVTTSVDGRRWTGLRLPGA